MLEIPSAVNSGTNSWRNTILQNCFRLPQNSTFQKIWLVKFESFLDNAEVNSNRLYITLKQLETHRMEGSTPTIITF